MPPLIQHPLTPGSSADTSHMVWANTESPSKSLVSKRRYEATRRIESRVTPRYLEIGATRRKTCTNAACATTVPKLDTTYATESPIGSLQFIYGHAYRLGNAN